jgi:DNA-binding transcriptional ArsR family regulator
LTLYEVVAAVGGTRQGVRRYVLVLVEAKLVYVVQDGRTRRLYYNAVPLQGLYDRWTDERSALLARSMLAVSEAVEATPE